MHLHLVGMIPVYLGHASIKLHHIPIYFNTSMKLYCYHQLKIPKQRTWVIDPQWIICPLKCSTQWRLKKKLINKENNKKYHDLNLNTRHK